MIFVIALLALVYAGSCLCTNHFLLRMKIWPHAIAWALVAVASGVGGIWSARLIGSSYGVVEMAFFALAGWAITFVASAIALFVRD